MELETWELNQMWTNRNGNTNWKQQKEIEMKIKVEM